MKLEDIGFYTLSDERAKNVDMNTDLQRCELILTSRCNFNCPYCRGMKKEDKGDMSVQMATDVVRLWGSHNLKSIRFSGGEPTIWKGLVGLVQYAKHLEITNIAISTNGSADLDYYLELIDAGVNDFSISLDSCCASTGNKMAGGLNVFDKVISNIKALSQLVYVTVGVVLTDDNYHEVNDIIKFASDLGVADIRIIPAAQVSKKLSGVVVDKEYLDKHKILNYRVKNFMAGHDVRGLKSYDNHQCPLALDDMVVMNGKHYPCVIHMREHGKEIGTIDANFNMHKIRRERAEWVKNHNCFADEICKNNCLDVCVDHNNKVMNTNTMALLGILDTYKSEIDPEDHIMTMEEFAESCEEGGFIDYDGFGHYSDGTYEFHKNIHPSDVTEGRYDKRFSHVIWFNR